MRILIDTNIFIYREDHAIISNNLQQLLVSLAKKGVMILVHPESIADLERDIDETRRNISLSKINTYPILESPPNYKKDQVFLDLIGYPSKINDDIDNSIIYSVYRNAVSFLVTEDKGLHKKAIVLNVKDRVLSIDEALEIYGESDKGKTITYLPALKNDSLHSLDIHDCFFDSLKRDYGDTIFEKWFKQKSQEGRKCFVHYKVDGLIGALLIYKEENEPINSTPIIPKARRLKLCTFKVSYIGNKIGELFLKLAVNLCIKNSIDEMYLTYIIKNDDDGYLIKLIEEYGFVDVAISNETNEHIFLKRLVIESNQLKSLSPIVISKKFYPTFYDGLRVNKFIVPIKPVWHSKLFPEYKSNSIRHRQPTLHEYLGEFVVEGNTIKKAYLSNSKITKISQGDLLLFYRSEDEKKITTIGVVEDIHFHLTDPEEIIRLVGKRTVYSFEAVRVMSQRPTTVILFTWHSHLSNPFSLDDLIKEEILKGAPQSIMMISHEKYLTVKNRGKVNERFTIN